MPENDKANDDSSEGAKDRHRAPKANLYWILVAGGILFAALLAGSILIPNLTERVKFFTTNALSLCVLAAIAVQAYIYHRQWQMMEKQNDIAQQNMIYAQRAYVTIPDGVETNGRPNSTFRLKVENSGNTPASTVEITGKVELRERWHETDLETVENLTTQRLGIIAPKHYHYFDIVRPDQSDEERQLWMAGKLRYYCFGSVHYQDFFGKARHTYFCLIVGKFNEQGLSELLPHTTGNEAT
jgi:hypothetical protein